MSTERIDNFTDAAFAFAVTLLVIGGSAAPSSHEMLVAAVAEVPAFAIGFAIIAMFWISHVRWRGYRGKGDGISLLLTILLVFLVLIYVQPLRAMARSFSTFLGGSGTPFSGDVGELFFIYGAGFVAMALTVLALFREALRNPALDEATKRSVRGEGYIWMIQVATGLTSITIASIDRIDEFAPLAYTTLPLTIGLFSWRYRWGGRDAQVSEGSVREAQQSRR